MCTSLRVREDGQSSLLLIPAVAGLLFAVLLVVSMLGDGVQKRTGARTAADAASLAAAEAWRSGADAAYRRALERPGEGLGALRGLLTSPVLELDEGRARAAAERYAAANGAELTAFDVRVTARGVEYLARARSLEVVEKTSTRPEATAVARVEVSGGLCFTGGGLGLVLRGSCRGPDDALPDPAPTPVPTATGPAPTPTPDPSDDSDGPGHGLDLGPLHWKVRLVQ